MLSRVHSGIGGEQYSTASATATVWSTVPETEPAPITPTSANKGSGITASITGGVITVSLDGEREGLWVGGILHSEPEFLWWRVVTDGQVTFAAPVGVWGEHRVALHDATGALIGWAAVSIPAVQGSGPSALAATGLPLQGMLGLAFLLLLAGAAVALRRVPRTS